MWAAAPVPAIAREVKVPLNQQPDSRSICSFINLLIFSNICVISLMSFLLYVHIRDHHEEVDPPVLPSFTLGSSNFYVLPRLEGVQASLAGTVPLICQGNSSIGYIWVAFTRHSEGWRGNMPLGPECFGGLHYREVGHKQKVKLVPDKTHVIKTLSLKPPVFEIPDFLSEDECELLISLAKCKGLNTSETSFSNFKDQFQNMPEMDQLDIFNQQDLNKDGKLQVIEMMTYLLIFIGSWLTPEDIQEMYVALKLDPDGNGVLTLDEFKEANMQDVYKYMEKKKANKAEFVRNSQQAWVFHSEGAHPVVHSIQQRVIRLTRLPTDIVERSEHLQVVRYDKGGYYHAHWDSSPFHPERGCVHTAMFGGGPFPSTCRYATVLFYLNNVTEGGETTFPIADNTTYDFVSLMQNNIDLRDTCRQCDKGNLRVKPVQGTAVFWYNFLPNEEGWAGNLDPYSLHGGCLVSEGTKWIANNWINVDPDLWKQLLFLRSPYVFNAGKEYCESTSDKSCSNACLETS